MLWEVLTQVSLKNGMVAPTECQCDASNGVRPQHVAPCIRPAQSFLMQRHSWHNLQCLHANPHACYLRNLIETLVARHLTEPNPFT